MLTKEELEPLLAMAGAAEATHNDKEFEAGLLYLYGAYCSATEEQREDLLKGLKAKVKPYYEYLTELFADDEDPEG